MDPRLPRCGDGRCGPHVARLMYNRVTARERRWVLSGGLASGKSQVRSVLEDRGVATIDADSIGHAVIRSDGSAFAQVADRWPDVLIAGEIDRSALAQIVFTDSEELRALEAITHPHIFGEIRRRVEEIGSTPVVVEIPLLEHGLGQSWRRMVVDTEDSLRIKRAVARGISIEDARARMAAQPPRRVWLSVADAVIPNRGTIADLDSTVARLLPKL
jgi:dephospho-CoA kinase